MSVDEATKRLLLRLQESEDREITAAEVENDPWFAANREVTAAAAHALATDVSIDVEERTDAPEWFPYRSMSARQDNS